MIDRRHELIVNGNHSYLLQDMGRHDIPLPLVMRIKHLIHEYQPTTKETET